MPLDMNIGVTGSNNSVQQQIGKFELGNDILSPEEVAVELAQSYFDYSLSGALPGADLSSGGDKTILDSGFVSDNSSDTISTIANSICDYWSSIVKTGAPAHGGTSVVSVVIDGTSKLLEMESAISSIVTDSSSGGWLDFYNATQDVVKTIPCYITEIVPPDNLPKVFTETII